MEELVSALVDRLPFTGCLKKMVQCFLHYLNITPFVWGHPVFGDIKFIYCSVRYSNCGVGEGSELGPIIFSLTIHDIDHN